MGKIWISKFPSSTGSPTHSHSHSHSHHPVKKKANLWGGFLARIAPVRSHLWPSSCSTLFPSALHVTYAHDGTLMRAFLSAYILSRDKLQTGCTMQCFVTHKCDVSATPNSRFLICSNQKWFVLMLAQPFSTSTLFWAMVLTHHFPQEALEILGVTPPGYFAWRGPTSVKMPKYIDVFIHGNCHLFIHSSVHGQCHPDERMSGSSAGSSTQESEFQCR